MVVRNVLSFLLCWVSLSGGGRGLARDLFVSRSVLGLRPRMGFFPISCVYRVLNVENIVMFPIESRWESLKTDC